MRILSVQDIIDVGLCWEDEDVHKLADGKEFWSLQDVLALHPDDLPGWDKIWLVTSGYLEPDRVAELLRDLLLHYIPIIMAGDPVAAQLVDILCEHPDGRIDVDIDADIPVVNRVMEALRAQAVVVDMGSTHWEQQAPIWAKHHLLSSIKHLVAERVRPHQNISARVIGALSLSHKVHTGAAGGTDPAHVAEKFIELLAGEVPS